MVSVTIIIKRRDICFNVYADRIHRRSMSLHYTRKSNETNLRVAHKPSQLKAGSCNVPRIDGFFTVGKFHVQVAGYGSQVCSNRTKSDKVMHEACEAASKMNIA